MDGDLRRLLLKFGGSIACLVVVAVGIKFGCGSSKSEGYKPRELEALFDKGCQAARLLPVDAKYKTCMERAMKECSASQELPQLCAERVGNAVAKE